MEKSNEGHATIYGSDSEKLDNKTLDWMYKGQTINREDYLLGKKVDKQFENLVEIEKEEKLNRLLQSTADQGGQVDLARKLKEDPFYVIKQKEMESRTALLKNPVKLKQLKQMLEKKNSIPKSKESKSNELLDKLLAEKYKKLKGKIDKEKLLKSVRKVEKSKKHKKRSRHSSSDSSETNSSDSSESSSSTDSEDSDSSEEKRRNNKHGSKRSHDKKYSIKRKCSSSDSDDFKKGKVKKIHKDHRDRSKRRDIVQSENEESSSSSSDYYRRKVKRRDSGNKTERSNLDYFDRRKMKKRQQEYSSKKRKADKAKDNRKYKYSDSDDSDNEKEISKKKNNKGAHKQKDDYKFNAKINDMDHSSKTNSSVKQTKKWDSKSDPIRKEKLSEAEKERKRQEMMSNAAWRDEVRSNNIKKYQQEDSKELKDKSKYDTSFLHKHLNNAINTGTVESRIKSNINSVQRSKLAMNSGLGRR